LILHPATHAAVIAAHRRTKDGVASLAYDAAIHDDALRMQTVMLFPWSRFMDPRVKPGGDA